MEMQKELIIGGRRVYITGRSYRTGPEEKTYRVPVIFWPVSEEHGRSISESAEYAAAGISASTRETDVYLLAAFEIEDWNRELSPWKAEIPEIGQSFGGRADETLRWIINEMIPRMKLTAGGSTELSYYVAGYSLAGLFALWSLTKTPVFSGAAACSATQWFPSWLKYLEMEGVCGRDHHTGDDDGSIIYLSLGGKEHKTSNPFIATILEATKACDDLLDRDSTVRRHVLEMNRGGHFSDPDGRVAKGAAWLIRNA